MAWHDWCCRSNHDEHIVQPMRKLSSRSALPATNSHFQHGPNGPTWSGVRLCVMPTSCLVRMSRRAAGAGTPTSTCLTSSGKWRACLLALPEAGPVVMPASNGCQHGGNPDTINKCFATVLPTHLSVEAAGAAQRFVQRVGAVGCAHDHHTRSCKKGKQVQMRWGMNGHKTQPSMLRDTAV